MAELDQIGCLERGLVVLGSRIFCGHSYFVLDSSAFSVCFSLPQSKKLTHSDNRW